MDWIIHRLNIILSYDFIMDNIIPFFLHIGKYALISISVAIFSYIFAYILSKTTDGPIEAIFTIITTIFIVISVIFVFILLFTFILGIWDFFTLAVSSAFSTMLEVDNNTLCKVISGIVCILLVQLLGHGINAKIGK